MAWGLWLPGRLAAPKMGCDLVGWARAFLPQVQGTTCLPRATRELPQSRGPGSFSSKQAGSHMCPVSTFQPGPC